MAGFCEAVAAKVDGTSDGGLQNRWRLELRAVLVEKGRAHDSVDDGMLAEQDDLPRRRDDEALKHSVNVERLESRHDSVLADLLLAPHALEQSS